MDSTVRGRAPRSRPGRRGWQLLVLLLSCGVIAMHSLGAGHPLGHVPGLTTVAVRAHAVAASDGEARPYRSAMALVVLGSSAAGEFTAGGHDGMAVCLAVLSLLAWVVLHRQRRPFRMVHGFGGVGRHPFTGPVRGPPGGRALSLSELCICRT